ncbi:hypothetical protein VP01_11492g1, partial [Puccinia sorghi]
KLPKSFWAEAVNTATQLSNLTPSITRNRSIPYHTPEAEQYNRRFRSSQHLRCLCEGFSTGERN